MLKVLYYLYNVNETKKQIDMNFQLKLNEEKLQSLNGQLNYINECLTQSDIKEWEKKECLKVKGTIEIAIEETKKLIEINKIGF